MKLSLRIRLRTIFLLFVCAAVGLATSRDPLGALEPAIATAMVIGLLQQARQLSLTPNGGQPSDLKFARQFALVWRVCLAAIIAACVVISLFYSNGMLRMDNDQKSALLFKVLFPITSISLTAVLCNSLTRWRPSAWDRTERPRKRLIFWLLAAILGLLVVVQGGLLAFLVHEAVAGIEAAIPARFQRPGVYPNLREEGFRPFWMAATAVATLGLASIILIGAIRPSNSKWSWITAIAIAGLLLMIPVVFCRWYYFSEFHRLSPELAGAGLEADWVQWLVGGTLAVALVTAIAYQLARSNHVEVISADLSHQIDSAALHESVPLLFIIAIHAVYVVALQIMQVASLASWFVPRNVMFFLSFLWYPTSLLVLAQAIAGLQLCWIRFEHRNQVTRWVLPGLSHRQFVRQLVLLSLLLAVAIPTFSAFGFIAWLGPWNLRRLYGF
jgi:hypothetical protein